MATKTLFSDFDDLLNICQDNVFKIAVLEEGIAMAGGVLLNITMRINVLDFQSKMNQAKRDGKIEGWMDGWMDGKQENRMEILDLIARGYTTEDIKRSLEAEDLFSSKN